MALGLISCADPSSLYDSAPLCDGAVRVTFSRDDATFDWAPACGVTEGSVVGATGAVWSFEVSELRPLAPPLRYGQAPSGAVVREGPGALEAGRRYAIHVWATVGRDVVVGGGSLEFDY